jgi:hypothetical protein
MEAPVVAAESALLKAEWRALGLIGPAETPKLGRSAVGVRVP